MKTNIFLRLQNGKIVEKAKIQSDKNNFVFSIKIFT